MDFTDRVIVITGGSKGFGKGLAKAFANKHARVVISSDDKEALAEAARELNIDSFPCDVTSFDEVKALADHTLKQFGRIDMWVNNAGIQIAPSNVEDIDVQKLHRL